jgi:hypothetical protein
MERLENDSVTATGQFANVRVAASTPSLVLAALMLARVGFGFAHARSTAPEIGCSSGGGGRDGRLSGLEGGNQTLHLAQTKGASWLTQLLIPGAVLPSLRRKATTYKETVRCPQSRIISTR